MQSYILVGGSCPILGCNNQARGKNTDWPGEFLDHFFYVHRAVGCQLSYPCPMANCPVVLSMPRTVYCHLKPSTSSKGTNTEEECQVLDSMHYPYPDQTVKMPSARATLFSRVDIFLCQLVTSAIFIYYQSATH